VPRSVWIYRTFSGPGDDDGKSKLDSMRGRVVIGGENE
jgi:hypothetical protein